MLTLTWMVCLVVSRDVQVVCTSWFTRFGFLCAIPDVTGLWSDELAFVETFFAESFSILKDVEELLGGSGVSFSGLVSAAG